MNIKYLVLVKLSDDTHWVAGEYDDRELAVIRIKSLNKKPCFAGMDKAIHEERV